MRNALNDDTVSLDSDNCTCISLDFEPEVSDPNISLFSVFI